MNAVSWLRANNNAALVRIAELIAVNGGSLTFTRPIGESEVSEANRYKRLGLNVPEFCELQYMRGLLEGLLASTQGREGQEVHTMIQQEISGSLIEIATPEQTKALLRLSNAKDSFGRYNT